MTVIVKPVQPPVSSSDEVIGAWLKCLLGTVSWPQFETTSDGNLIILNTKFSMRVGQFMTMPTQAIIACDQFVVMRQRADFKEHDLNVLVPDQADGCLYQGRWNPPLKENEDESHIKKMLQMLAEMEKNQVSPAQKRTLAEKIHGMQRLKMLRSQQEQRDISPLNDRYRRY